MGSMKSKLLLLITQAEWGGAQRYVYDLAAGFRDDFSVTVACGEPRGRHELIERVRHIGVRTHRFHHLIRNIHPVHDLLAIFELGRFLRRERFDIVHANASKSGAIASFACALFGVKTKLVYTAHGWVFNEPRGLVVRSFYLMMEKLAARRRDATIVLSESEKNDALRHGLSSSKRLFVIPHGIDLPADFFLSREEARNRLGLRPDEHVVGAIGNIYANKGYRFLVEAMQDVPARLVVIGAVRYNEWQARAAEHVMFAGAIADASRYLKAFDVFAISSVKEGLPYVLLEAMAAGVPIVATRVGAIPEVIEHQKTGLLVRPADPRVIRDAIKLLLADANLSSKLASAARAVITQTYRLDEQLKKTKQVLTSFGQSQD